METLQAHKRSNLSSSSPNSGTIAALQPPNQTVVFGMCHNSRCNMYTVPKPLKHAAGRLELPQTSTPGTITSSTMHIEVYTCIR